MTADVDQYVRDIQRQYADFLDDEADQGYYQGKIADMVQKNECRLIVNINDIRAKNESRAIKLLEESVNEQIAFQRALKSIVMAASEVYGKKHDEFYVGFEGSFGSKHVTPRSLGARFLGNMVCCEGIVTKCSLIRPKVVRSVHYCPETKKTIERNYTDMTSLNAFPSSSVYPTKDEDGNPLETEYGLSIYKDHQTFTIQEMPEKSPAGQLPRSVDIVADNDLVDKCKPGDRVQVIGIYRCLPSKKSGHTSGTFRTIIISNNIKILSKEVSPNFSTSDLSKIRKFSRGKEDVFEALSKSLAPSIHGHEYIKKAILCLLLGGTEKVLENGTRLRGDINIMMVGDPSTAKSQLLRYVLHTAPRAIPTTGRGSSGVGLTAAVTTDQETGERRLEAGAMVLADRGVVCIDEFDKMTDMDRTAIHEVMEQGRVTIAKAGIHAKLNARCSVLAAANPVYGRYDPYKTPMENIGMQDSLLSRFDLLFIVLDQIDPDIDRKISDHVLRMHKYRAAGEQDGDPLPFGNTTDILSTYDIDADEDEDDAPIYEKKDAKLYGVAKSRKEKFVSIPFMKKYIHLAKSLRPALSQEAADIISNAYSDLRDQETVNSDMAKTMPVTARTLETMIRLATAHAKARMSKTITSMDAEAAIEMVQFAYFHKIPDEGHVLETGVWAASMSFKLHAQLDPLKENLRDFFKSKVEKKEKKKKRKGDEMAEDEEEEEEGESQEDGGSRKKSESSKKAKMTSRKPGEEGYDPFDFDEEEEESAPADSSRKRRRGTEDEEMDTTSAERPDLSDNRLSQFKVSLQNLFASEHAQSLPLERIAAAVNRDHPSAQFAPEEIDVALERMQEDNQVMVSDRLVFLI